MSPRSPSTTTPTARATRRGPWGTVATMLAAIFVVTTLAFWDEQREAGAALADLESEQSLLASSLAGDVQAHLARARRDAAWIAEHGADESTSTYAPIVVRAADAPPAAALDPARVRISVPVAGGRAVDLGVPPGDLVDRGEPLRSSHLLVLLATPDDPSSLRTMDGRVVRSSVIGDAIDRRATTLRLARPEAAEIGLPARTAMAGIASVSAGDGPPWSVVTVASAARERDREKRAMVRLVLGVLVASGLVLAFGGAALKRQREQLELERELAVADAQRERNEELLRAERVATMGTFALGIAHEVSTPLGVIVGRAEQLLGRANADERTERIAHAILRQSNQIRHIVRRFMDMARGRPPSMDRADPAEIARAAAAAVEHRFLRAHVALALEIPPTMPHVQCDRDLLEHAIVNLLLNACEACESGGRVSLTARADEQHVAFVVVDDGPGISEGAAARAAEPFFTTKPQGVGTGLGLAIAAEIVKSHHGRLAIGPNAGHGTRASIEVPVPSDAVRASGV